MTGAEFRAINPPRAVWDAVLGRHVLAFGSWHDVRGALLGYEICSLTQTRRPDQVREVLSPTAVSLIPAEVIP